MESESVLDARNTELKVDEILAEFLSKKIGDSNVPENPSKKEKKHKYHKHKHKKSKSSHKEKKTKKHHKKSQSRHKTKHRHRSLSKSPSLSETSKKSHNNSENKLGNEESEDVQDCRKNDVKEQSLICTEYHSEDELINKKLEKLQNHIIEKNSLLNTASSEVFSTDESQVIVTENLSNHCTASEKQDCSQVDESLSIQTEEKVDEITLENNAGSTRSEEAVAAKELEECSQKELTDVKIQAITSKESEINSSLDLSLVNEKDDKIKDKKYSKKSRTPTKIHAFICQKEKHKHNKSKPSHKEKKSKKSKKHNKKSYSHKTRHRHRSLSKSPSLSEISKKSHDNPKNKLENKELENVQDCRKNYVKEQSLVCTEYHSEDELINKKLEKLQSHINEKKNTLNAPSSNVFSSDEVVENQVAATEHLSNHCTASQKQHHSQVEESLSNKKEEKADNVTFENNANLTRSEETVAAKELEECAQRESTDMEIQTITSTENKVNSSDRDLTLVNKNDDKTTDKKHSKRSRASSRSRAKKSKRSYSRHQSRSRSPEYRRRRSRSRSRSKRVKHDYRHSYRSKRKYGRHSRSSSRSPTPKRRRSRDSRRSPKENSDKLKIDKNRLLEIARKNAISMIQTGLIPVNVNKDKEQMVAITSGGRSVAELTDFCKSLAQGSNSYSSDNEKSDDEDSKSEEDEGPFPFINHPFKVSDNRPNIIMNIRNAVQVPVKTPAEKATEQAKLRLQFPVSSGSQHRVKESEWVPVIKEKKTESQKCPTISAIPTLTLEQQINESTPDLSAEVSENQSQAAVDLSKIVSERLSALSKLKENPQDVVALNAMHKAEKKMQSWVQSKQLPGQFTGSTDAQLLSPDQLSGPNQAWVRKEEKERKNLIC